LFGYWNTRTDVNSCSHCTLQYTNIFSLSIRHLAARFEGVFWYPRRFDDHIKSQLAANIRNVIVTRKSASGKCVRKANFRGAKDDSQNCFSQKCEILTYSCVK
jgi:hypothetical protein